MLKVEVGGRELPCRATMGAMLRFKRETGHEVSELDGSLSEVVTWLWCCVTSACAADGIEFGLPLMEFADRVDPTTLNQFMEQSAAENASDSVDEKKSE
jgi:hypothetical protein